MGRLRSLTTSANALSMISFSLVERLRTVVAEQIYSCLRSRSTAHVGGPQLRPPWWILSAPWRLGAAAKLTLDLLHRRGRWLRGAAPPTRGGTAYPRIVERIGPNRLLGESCKTEARAAHGDRLLEVMSRRLSLLSLGASSDGIQGSPLCLLNGRNRVVDCDICFPF